MVPGAVMSLMVKIAQVDFVTEELCWSWTMLEWLRLYAFVNNVVGITPDQGEVATNAVLEHVGRDDHHFSENWKGALADGLAETFGNMKGFIIHATLTTDDVSECLKKTHPNK
uniref:Uncharacterized protein n=1 Tax=Noctiluca scintillans TaxID=2966 RepID=A0A7S1A8V6_NOCSC